MNDEFLLRYRRTPRAEFADALYGRISSQPEPRFAIPVLSNLTFRNVGAMLALMLFVAACAYVVAEKRWNKVGDIWVDVQKSPKQSLGIQSSFWKGPAGEMEVANLEEARSVLGVEFGFPNWAPEGFVLDNKMNMSPWSQKTLSAFWNNRDGGDPIGIFLNYRWFDLGAGPNPIYESVSTEPVAPGSFEEVLVLGQPAVLVRGDWNWQMQPVTADPTEVVLSWDENRGLSLYWADDDVAYLLWTYNPAVSPEDLIRMAESAR
jgi:hypothetical protein